MTNQTFKVAIDTEIHFDEGASRVVDVFDDPFDGTMVELEHVSVPGATPAPSFFMPISLLAAIVDAYEVLIVLPGRTEDFGEAA